ncbi:MAG TPA: Gfo/Idh/MocA family oxidoreductase [Methylomirabilota bacterium]|nr:Gfo/Idh/MocA family oxidoreductase [Methylomirabilota bacterium]
MNRRTFIATTGAFAVASPCLIRAAEKPRIRVGFLGASHSHASEKFRIVSASTDFELLGVCEESEKVREPLAQLGARFVSRADLLDRAEVVIVESAVRDHARDAKAALEAGQHVHVEKPPAATMREGEDLVRLAREKNRLLQVGYMWRLQPGINRVIQAAQKGWLGEVFLVRAQINTQLDAKRRAEWAEFNGGSMFELGCHLIDPVVRLLGKPARVTPHLQRRGGDNLADNCVAIFEFAKAQAIITSSVLQPNAPSHRFLEILGTNGTARVGPIEPPALTLDLAKAAGPYKAGKQTIELPMYRRYVAEFSELALAIRERQPLSTSPDDELRVHETLLRACEMV